jgi:Protein of unknown function (DUF1570)
MHGASGQGRGRRAGSTRREWMVGALLGGIGLDARGGEPAGDDTTHEEAAVQARARRSGLRPFRSTVTEHYLGIGDSPDAHRERALQISKLLAATYRKHFHEKGFAVEFPEYRLTVVTLKDKASYERFVGETPGENDGGHFNLDTNRLVVFDFRPAPGDENPIANAERVNTFTLIHEGLHQLTYNTGLLNLRGDVPVAISEGLATYGELWRPGGRLAFGSVNGFRLNVLKARDDLLEVWLPVAKLLADDAVLHGAGTEQLAYAQSWLLVHYLMRPGQVRKFRAYLDAIRERRDPAERFQDATGHLGDLDRLDRVLKKYAVGLM